MIIFDKVNEIYSKKDLIAKLGSYTYYYNFYINNDKIKLEKLARILELKEIYSFTDFLNDFSKRIKVYKEKKTIYNILIDGVSVADFLKFSKNISSQLYYGFISETSCFSLEQLKYIEIDYDISSLNCSFFEKHIELYGDKKKLLEFKKKHNIKQKILWEFEMETWHLAFKGLLAEKIRYDFYEKKKAL